MTMPEETFVHRTRAAYHAAATQLDPRLAARLRDARRAALAHGQHAGHRVVRWLVPSGACAAIALAAVLSWPPLPREPIAPPATTAVVSQAAEADNLLPPDPEQADPALYQNLDFYGWLAANDRQPAH